MQHKNKEFCFWGYKTDVYFISPDPQTWEEIILPEGRKPFPEANVWAVTWHPTEPGMSYKGEDTQGWAIKTVASRFLSWGKDWGGTEANQSPELKAEDGKCPSFFRHCEKMALPLPAGFALLWCAPPVLPREVSWQMSCSPLAQHWGDSCCCTAPRAPGLQLFSFPQITDERNLTKTTGQIVLSGKSLGRESGALGSHRCCIIKSWCPLAPELDWLQVHLGQGKSCALPCPLAELRICI